MPVWPWLGSNGFPHEHSLTLFSCRIQSEVKQKHNISNAFNRLEARLNYPEKQKGNLRDQNGLTWLISPSLVSEILGCFECHSIELLKARRRRTRLSATDTSFMSNLNTPCLCSEQNHVNHIRNFKLKKKDSNSIQTHCTSVTFFHRHNDW